MKTVDEIIETLKDCMNAVKDYEQSEEGGDLINQGWIEALKYVLDEDAMGITATQETNENNKGGSQ